MKDTFTTGEVAKICRVAPRTVCSWCKKGVIDFYVIPGSPDRRITSEALHKLFNEYGMPKHWLEEAFRK